MFYLRNHTLKLKRISSLLILNIVIFKFSKKKNKIFSAKQSNQRYPNIYHFKLFIILNHQASKMVYKD